MICGHTLQAGERVVIVDDGVSTGQSVDRWIEETKKCADIHVVALVTIFARDDMPGGIGRHLLEEKYSAKVYSVISDQDIQKALEKLGIPVSIFIDMTYRQVIANNGIPFALNLPKTIETRDQVKQLKK